MTPSSTHGSTRHPPPGAGSGHRASMAQLTQSQSELLASLRDPASGHGELLVALLINNCLLELSRLTQGHLSLTEYVQAVVTCLGQFAPLERCALMIEPPNLVPARSALGSWPDESFDAALLERANGLNGGPGATTGTPDERVCPVTAEDPSTTIGYLGIGGVPKELLDAGLVERCAELISTVLGLLVQHERLRRAAAADHAIDLIARLTDEYGEPELAEVATALHLLPGVTAARIVTEIPRFGGPLSVEAGVTSGSHEPFERVDVVHERGCITLQLWRADDQAGDSRVDAVLDRLAAAVTRIEHHVGLAAESETDPLTGVGNRRRGSRAIAQARNRAERTGEEFAVLMMDLDRFKTVNDDLGHETGDLVLCAFAQALCDTVRGYDVIARWGGEEFLAVCPNMDTEGAEALAQRVLATTPTACALALPDGRIQTVSIGIAVNRHPATNPVELLRTADAALHGAKTLGRNRAVTAPPLRS